MKSNKIFTSNKNEGAYHILLPLIIGIICIIIAVIAIGRIAVIKIGYKVATSQYSELYESMPFSDKQFHPTAWRRQQAPKGMNVESTPIKRSTVRADPMEVAFRLQEIAHSFNDIIGWIDFETLPISYPLLHGETNDDYLRTTYKGTKAPAGSIFMESLNSSDFTDPHTIIYGHNMKDGSMFGQLKQYESAEFLESNKYFTIYTPGGDVFPYEIISCMVVPLDSFVYKISFADDDEYSSFIQMLGYGGPDMPQSVTLSTCAGVDKTYRLVVNAMRMQ